MHVQITMWMSLSSTLEYFKKLSVSREINFLFSFIKYQIFLIYLVQLSDYAKDTKKNIYIYDIYKTYI